MAASKEECQWRWNTRVKGAIKSLKDRIAENDAAPAKDKNHAKSIEDAAIHLRKEMKKFAGWPNLCLDKKRRPKNLTEEEWKEAEGLVKEYAPAETSLWEKVRDKITNPPNVPDVWWDGDPFDPWKLVPWPRRGRGPIID